MIPHALGMLVKGRWELTRQTLESIYYSEQLKATYDFYVINNGSDEETTAKLKEYVRGGLVPIKNLLHIPETSVPSAWNLFLMLTAEYPFRTKVDNDVVLHNTLKPPLQKSPIYAASPDKGDPLAGAPRSKSIIRGIGQGNRSRTVVANDIKFHSAFLQHMEEFGEENNVGIVGLISVPPRGGFSQVFTDLATAQHDGRPFIQSGCIQISKSAFSKLGYLDESLAQYCFREYSQRAIKNKINIGYHPYYGLLHAGANASTTFSDSLKPAEAHNSTMWLDYEKSIRTICQNHKIVHVD